VTPGRLVPLAMGWRVQAHVLVAGCSEVEEVSGEVGDLRQSGLDVLLEVLHSHGGQIKQLICHLVGSRQFGRHLDVMEDAIHLVQYLASKEADVLALNVLAKAHLEQGEAHV